MACLSFFIVEDPEKLSFGRGWVAEPGDGTNPASHLMAAKCESGADRMITSNL